MRPRPRGRRSSRNGSVGDQPFEPHRLRPVPQTSRAPRTTPAARPAARTRKHRSARLTCPLRRLPPVPCDPIGLSIRIPSPAASASPLTNVTRGWAPYKCRAMGSALFPLDRGGKGRCTIGAVAAEGEHRTIEDPNARHQRRTKRVRCMPLSGRNRSFLFNCGLNIVQVLQEGLFRHALEQQPHWDRQ